ncbi:hypothetical protein BDV96DRAFT_627694 [Lophiotrema nucula]|uniref:Uncharacterized protein n=1 Tax=Lophiotrema nucula TaxID=690887 RepID=A0A6A5ZNR8_9PLEO|nr:hypothetical protein BDV96DRAFT_627694 [Lophiotrema nucula]
MLIDPALLTLTLPSLAVDSIIPNLRHLKLTVVPASDPTALMNQLQHATIESLEVNLHFQYGKEQMYRWWNYGRYKGLSVRHKLPWLQTLNLTNGWFEASELVGYLRMHATTLSDLTLEDCSVVTGGRDLPLDPNTWGTWLPVIVGLQALPNLTCLVLHYLEADPLPVGDQSKHQHLDERLSTLSEWSGRIDIEVGLRYLALTQQTVKWPGGWNLLNLRYANFKVSPLAMGWTEKEIPYIYEQQRASEEGEEDRLLENDSVEFPIPEESKRAEWTGDRE